MNEPNPPEGSGLLENWCRRLLAYCRANRIISISGGRLKRGPQGTMIEIEGGGGSTPAKKAQSFSVQEHFGAVLRCRSFDGSATGATDVWIAKPWELRFPAPNSSNGETLDGTILIYNQYNTIDQTRVANGTDPTGTFTELQVIVRRYLVGDLIWADEPEHLCLADSQLLDIPSGVVGSIKLMDQNRGGRYWAKKYLPNG